MRFFYCLSVSWGARCSSVVRWVIGSILHGVDPLSYFSFQPVLHDWCNKGCGMCYPVCGMVHIKELLLLIKKSSPCGSSVFPFWLSEWSFTICPMPYNHKQNVLSASLNKAFPSFLSLPPVFLHSVCNVRSISNAMYVKHPCTLQKVESDWPEPLIEILNKRSPLNYLPH